MARFLILILSLTVSAATFASTPKSKLFCARDEFGDEEGYVVTIAPSATKTKATLFVIDPSGKHAVGNYTVVYIPADKPENLASYQGMDFSLQLQPVGEQTNGLISATLKAFSKEVGLEIEDTLLCREE